MYKNNGNAKMNGKNSDNSKTIFGIVEPISIEEEITLVSSIRSGKDLISKHNSGLSEEQKKLKKEAVVATQKLIKAYSPLIEGIAKSHYRKAGHDRVEVEDFINEAYIVAVQCCYSFDPYASKDKVIRFSSYAPRAISSALQRMANRTRPIASVPTTVMSDARKWSHVLFDMKNMGIDISDDEVSLISGVSSSQFDIRSVLGLSQYVELEDVNSPSIEDGVDITPYEYQKELLSQAVKEVFGDYSREAMQILGLESDEVLNTPFLLSASGVMGREKAADFLTKFVSYINHPSTRLKIAEIINNSNKQ